MTLDTRIVIQQPLPVRRVFDHCRKLIGATDDYWFEDDRAPEHGNPSLAMRPGQGLPAWLIVYHGGDGPLQRDEPAPEIPAKPDGFIEVSFDTAYSYRAPNGAGCSDLHAWLVRELGRWLEGEHGVTWTWQNEFTGEWFSGYDSLAELGDPDRGALDTVPA